MNTASCWPVRAFALIASFPPPPRSPSLKRTRCSYALGTGYAAVPLACDDSVRRDSRQIHSRLLNWYTVKFKLTHYHKRHPVEVTVLRSAQRIAPELRHPETTWVPIAAQPRRSKLAPFTRESQFWRYDVGKCCRLPNSNSWSRTRCAAFRGAFAGS